MASVRRVVAPNPGPYTGPGTNTWLIDAGTVSVVIDPGPDDDAHLAAIERALKGTTVAVVMVTHSHPDHLPLAERVASKHRASVRRFPELADGDVVRAGNLNITALHTPGHSSDHLAFWLPADRALFTGDLVLGRGSSMVTYPEGDVAAYLRSLTRLVALNPAQRNFVARSDVFRHREPRGVNVDDLSGGNRANGDDHVVVARNTDDSGTRGSDGGGGVVAKLFPKPASPNGSGKPGSKRPKQRR